MGNDASSRPRFITFEGGEGAGKSTQIKLLAAWLEDMGIACHLTREPGGSPGAEEIRSLLVTGEPDRWHSKTEALLMTAARAEHVERTIKPALKSGKWVLSDRFADSSIAYQGAGRGLGIDVVRNLQNWALEGFGPDLVILLDMPVEDGLLRARGREATKVTAEDRFEKLDDGFHESLRQAFLGLASSTPERYAVIDARGSVDDIHQGIAATVKKRLGL